MLLSRLFQRFVLQSLWATFLALGIAFFFFGMASTSLVRLLTSNLSLLGTYGLQAIQEGALRQLAELVANGYVAMAAYVVLKTCEYRLSHWLSGDS